MITRISGCSPFFLGVFCLSAQQAGSSAALEAASSSSRMRAEWAGLPWECRASQSSQARPREAQEPTLGTAKRRHFGPAVLQLICSDELLLEVAHVGMVVAELVLDARHLDGVRGLELGPGPGLVGLG